MLGRQLCLNDRLRPRTRTRTSNTKIAPASPIKATASPMFVSLNSLTLDDLETGRLVLNWLTILATAGVCIGVFLEGERFSSAVQKQAWGILVICIGAETLFGVALLQDDAQITRIENAKNVALQENVEVLRSKNLEEARKIIELQTALNEQTSKLGGVAMTVQSVATRVEDRGISDERRELIMRHLKGNGRRITIVLPSNREPRAYGAKIGEVLKSAGFSVFSEDWRSATPPDTGVVFCEVESGDRQIYEALRRADVATRFVGLRDSRPDFCDKPGVEFPIENLIAGLTLGAVTPQTVGGRIIPRGSLAGERGPRIFVGQSGQ